MSEPKFAKGIYFDKPREGAPDFVRGRLSVNVDEAVEYLKSVRSEKGYANFDLLKSKDGTKLYFTLNDWKPEAPVNLDNAGTPNDDIKAEDIPFWVKPIHYTHLTAS